MYKKLIHNSRDLPYKVRQDLLNNGNVSRNKWVGLSLVLIEAANKKITFFSGPNSFYDIYCAHEPEHCNDVQ